VSQFDNVWNVYAYYIFQTYLNVCYSDTVNTYTSIRGLKDTQLNVFNRQPSVASDRLAT